MNTVSANREVWNVRVIGFLTPVVVLLTSLVRYGITDFVTIAYMIPMILLIGVATVLIANAAPRDRDIVAVLVVTVAIALYNGLVGGVMSFIWLLNIAPTALVGTCLAIMVKKFHADVKLKVLAIIVACATAITFWIRLWIKVGL